MRGAIFNFKGEFVFGKSCQLRDVVGEVPGFTLGYCSESGPRGTTCGVFVRKDPHQVNRCSRRLNLRGKREFGKGEECVFLGPNSTIVGVVDRNGEGLVPLSKLALWDIHEPKTVLEFGP